MMCDCKIAGWCERHKMRKTEPQFNLCQDPEICAQYDRGEGPGQVKPNILQKAVNFGIAVSKEIIKGEKVPQSVADFRLMECMICEYKDVHGECTKCGCPVEEKIWFSTEKCPDNPPRWEKYSSKSDGGCGECK
jgi:hypothetical protein